VVLYIYTQLGYPQFEYRIYEWGHIGGHTTTSVGFLFTRRVTI
jgi:hypothetical protein